MGKAHRVPVMTDEQRELVRRPEVRQAIRDAVEKGERTVKVPKQNSPVDVEASFRDAVIDALVVAHIYRAEHDTDPRKAINDLLVYEAQIAVDPLVSAEAQALIAQGRAQSAEAVEALRVIVFEGLDYSGRLIPSETLRGRLVDARAVLAAADKEGG